MFSIPWISRNKERWLVIAGEHAMNKVGSCWFCYLNYWRELLVNRQGREIQSKHVFSLIEGMELGIQRNDREWERWELHRKRNWGICRGFPSSLQQGAYLSGNHKWPGKKSHKRAEGTTLRVCRGQAIGLFLSIQVGKLITNGELEYSEGYCLNNEEQIIFGQNTAWVLCKKA